MLRGEHDLETDTLKIALYNDTASLGANTTGYTTSHEIVEPGYTAGGVALANVVVSADGSNAIVTCDSPVWTGVTFNTDAPRGALIYRVSDGKAVAVINFGSNQYVASGDFTINIPFTLNAMIFGRFA